MSESFSSLSRIVSASAKWFAGTGLMLMTAIIAWQVFARYVLNASPAWAEQAALLLMIWYVLFAAAAGVREGFHIRISVLSNALPDKAQRAMQAAAHIIVGMFGLAMVWWGAELIAEVWGHVIPTLGISRGWAYVPMPLAGLMIAAFAAEHLVADLRGREVEKVWN